MGLARRSATVSRVNMNQAGVFVPPRFPVDGLQESAIDIGRAVQSQ